MRKLHQDESGITALETAVILIAFIVSAAVFAFVLLNAGVFSTHRGKEAILSGLKEVSSALELRGDVVALANTTGMSGTVNSLVFTISPVVNGEAVDLSNLVGEQAALKISYQDAQQVRTQLEWQVEWLVGDGDVLLEQDELVQITIPNLDTQLSPALGPNTRFTLEITPVHGPVLSLQRLTPATFDSVTPLR